MIKKLKARWNIFSNFQLIVILIVFSVTGSTAVMIRRPILALLGLTRTTFGNEWYFQLLYYTCYVLILFPIYQILLMIFAFLFRQFPFFWAFEKKMLTRLGVFRLLKKIRIKQ